MAFPLDRADRRCARSVQQAKDQEGIGIDRAEAPGPQGRSQLRHPGAGIDVADGKQYSAAGDHDLLCRQTAQQRHGDLPHTEPRRF